MQPSARKKIQRGIRRPNAPCSESSSEANSQRKAAGIQSMSVSNYSDIIERGVVSFGDAAAW